MSNALPHCDPQPPACGACMGDTEHDGDSFYCPDCHLDFGRGDGLEEAEFRDPETPSCGKPCTNAWHEKEQALGRGYAYNCHSCALPEDHTSDCWTNCDLVRIPHV